MKNSAKISVLGALMLFSASLYSQNDSLGMPGDNLDLKAVLSIFKQSSSIEDFEKRLNSADSKVNNLDLNGDNQVDYLRVVDYGKEDFHTIVIQDPISKSETQDVAVIQIVKKDNNTAHIQIVGDEILYGKDYIIEPSNQTALRATSVDNAVNDDVYATPDSPSDTHVMVNVWGWPSVTYIYSPGYSYWVSPWYWGYYPGWYSPWRPYGWYAYHNGWVGYNYGFYGYRRHQYAFPHAHNYYYGRRVTSGYVNKTAPNYGRRRDGYHHDGHRTVQPRNSGGRHQTSDRNTSNRNNQRVGRSNRNSQRQNNVGTQRNTNKSDYNQRNTNNQRQSQGNGRVNGGSRSSGSGSVRSGGGERINSGSSGNGGGRINSGSGGGRMSGGSPGGGGGRSGSGGGGRSSGGGANRR